MKAVEIAPKDMITEESTVMIVFLDIDLAIVKGISIFRLGGFLLLTALSFFFGITLQTK